MFAQRSSETTDGMRSQEESVLVSSELAVESGKSLCESRLAATLCTPLQSAGSWRSPLTASVDIKEVEGEKNE